MNEPTSKLAWNEVPIDQLNREGLIEALTHTHKRINQLKDEREALERLLVRIYAITTLPDPVGSALKGLILELSREPARDSFLQGEQK